MADRVVVLGAGGFGREALDVLEATIFAGNQAELLGVVDSGPSSLDLHRLAVRGIPYLGPEEEWLRSTVGDERFIIAIGDPRIRRAAALRFTAAGLLPISITHPRAVVGSQATIGDGVVIASGVQVSTNVTLGDHVHLNPGCIIGHDAALGEFVSVNPGAIVSGGVTAESTSLVGAGSIVLQGLTVGKDAIVGAGACVTRDIAPGTTVVGVPARPLGVPTASRENGR